LTECLERGAAVESDVYQNLRALLPQNVRQNFPEELPFVPAQERSQIAVAEVEPEPKVTYTSASVAEEQAG